MTAAALSPAERYAAARRRSAYPRLQEFEATLDFPLDPFQSRACEALEDGEGVLVAAPTGAGKTVVGEFAVHLALAEGRKCFYTTPIKALSNQKFHDLSRRHGSERVGLLTGDNSVNGDAEVVVMTTEVLRNMLYAASPALAGLGYVVMDEVHYLSDRFRGAVWEEVIIHLPDAVRLVSLSATVSNTEEFADWLVTVRGDTRVVVEEHRPVPLWQSVLVGPRLVDLFVDRGGEAVLNPELTRLVKDARARPQRGRPGRGRPPQAGLRVPSRPDVLQRLDAAGLLPAITFVFSRAGCSAAVAQCVRAGLRLNTPQERAAVRAHVHARTADLPAEDLALLGYAEWLDGLERGLAAHHAGMLPTFKEIVEELFVQGLVKAVFATETLALGINMPARSVVLERLSKWNGETHTDLTPGEFTQLTGRAGRRGIDVEGHAIVVWHPELDLDYVGSLAAARTYPLRSSFRPSYNMAVNLVGTVGRERARALLEASFAQFQADRSVVGIGRQVTRNLAALDGYAQAMSCDLGDFAEYAGLRRQLGDRERTLARHTAANRRAETAEALERLRPGDVVQVSAGRRAGLAVVVDTGRTRDGDSHPLVVTEDRWAGRLTAADFPAGVEPLTRVKVPRTFNARSPQARRDLAATLRVSGASATRPRRRERTRGGAADDPVLGQLRAALRAHPCHRCPEREEHARWAERWTRLRRDTDALEQRVAGKTGTIARTFDRVCGVLEQVGYLTPGSDTVTAEGKRLARVYSEADLLAVEALHAGVFDALDPAGLAAVVSALVYETRRDGPVAARLPGGPVAAALSDLGRLFAGLEAVERDAGLAFLREPDPAFAWACWQWASGQPLNRVLGGGADGEQISAGDFVRWTKQVIDLLEQVAAVAAPGSPVARAAPRSAAALRRGVVAYTSVA